MLTITVTQETVRVPVSVMSLEGELDAASYLDAIARVRQLIDEGTAYILMDLGSLAYMGSSGLFVLHTVAIMLRGQQPPDPDAGWGAIHQVEGDSESEGNLKLLSPQPQVERALERSGMKSYFETYTDRNEALASFG